MTTQAVLRLWRKPAHLAFLLWSLLAAAGVAPAQSPPATSGSPPEASTAAAAPTMSRKTWVPPDVDAFVPPVSPNVPCPLPEVLAAVGAHVQELVQNLREFSAKEHIEHVQVDKRGRSGQPESATFDYVVEIRASVTEGTRIQEYRNGSDSRIFQGGLATTGTAAHALILHPDIIGDYTVTCEGLGSFQGKPAWQLHFVQRPDKPARFRTYQTQHGAFPVSLKGRAWIATVTYQILRMETDLVKPLPELRLLEDHVIVDYGPVGFPKRNVQLWLPQTADLYMDLLGKRSYRHLSFSDFELFWVDVKHKERPKEQEQ